MEIVAFPKVLADRGICVHCDIEDFEQEMFSICAIAASILEAMGTGEGLAIAIHPISRFHPATEAKQPTISCHSNFP